MGITKRKIVAAEVEVEIPTVLNLLQLTAKIAETQGFQASEIVNAVNSVLHFPMVLEFDQKEANG